MKEVEGGLDYRLITNLRPFPIKETIPPVNRETIQAGYVTELPTFIDYPNYFPVWVKARMVDRCVINNYLPRVGSVFVSFGRLV